MTPEIVESIEDESLHYLAIRLDGRIVGAGGPPEEPAVAALTRHPEVAGVSSFAGR